MATLVTEPASSNPQTADWQYLLSKTEKMARGLGLMVCRLTNMGNSSEPQVELGSRFEVNGSTYECAADESITGWSGISTCALAYVYATPGTGVATFSYSATAPTWSTPLGGYYNGTARALFRVYKTSATEYTSKQVLDLIDTIPVVTTDPASPAIGQIWLRLDLL